MEAFEPVLEHVKAHMGVYIGGGIAALILIVVFRKYAIPLLAKALELLVYYVAMHVGVGTFVRLVSWFKASTSMRALRESVDDVNPHWTTPFFEFWDRTLYEPSWVFYTEIGFVVAITALTLYIRPPYFGKKKVARATLVKHAKYDRDGKRVDPKKPGAAGAPPNAKGGPKS